jgi:hypothetical protein
VVIREEKLLLFSTAVAKLWQELGKVSRSELAGI